MRAALAVLLLAVACDGAPSTAPSGPPGPSPGTREWANVRCADAWYLQGIVRAEEPHTVEGFPTTVGKLVEWNTAGRGDLNAGRSEVQPTAKPDALAAVCLYTGDFGAAEGRQPSGPSAEPPRHRSLLLFVYADGAPMSGVTLSTGESQFATPPPAPG